MSKNLSLIDGEKQSSDDETVPEDKPKFSTTQLSLEEAIIQIQAEKIFFLSDDLELSELFELLSVANLNTIQDLIAKDKIFVPAKTQIEAWKDIEDLILEKFEVQPYIFCKRKKTP